MSAKSFHSEFYSIFLQECHVLTLLHVIFRATIFVHKEFCMKKFTLLAILALVLASNLFAQAWGTIWENIGTRTSTSASYPISNHNVHPNEMTDPDYSVNFPAITAQEVYGTAETYLVTFLSYYALSGDARSRQIGRFQTEFLQKEKFQLYVWSTPDVCECILSMAVRSERNTGKFRLSIGFQFPNVTRTPVASPAPPASNPTPPQTEVSVVAGDIPVPGARYPILSYDVLPKDIPDNRHIVELQQVPSSQVRSISRDYFSRFMSYYGVAGTVRATQASAFERVFPSRSGKYQITITDSEGATVAVMVLTNNRSDAPDRYNLEFTYYFNP
jgi:hypothetical protein